MRSERSEVAAIRPVAARILGGDVEVEAVEEGASTHVYRLIRGTETFYLRVLPEEDATFAPEAEAHAILRGKGVRVPEVVYCEDWNTALDRSIMITRAIRGRPLAQGDPGTALPALLHAAGRDLALIGQVPVEGFGWVRRDAAAGAGLRGEVTGERDFMLAELAPSLRVLNGTLLDSGSVDTIRTVVRENEGLLDAPHACLAHGDFDVTHIFWEDGCYTGIIDLGEIRGTGPFYDLGHFRFHDGETVPQILLPSLLEGYADGAPLPPGVERRIALNSLLIGVRFLARTHDRLRPRHRAHALAAIARDVRALTSPRADWPIR